MAQTKKTEVRAAIIESAYDLFKSKGYIRCTMAQIAKQACTSVANLYVYFPSKLHLFYEVYSPILMARMVRLANDVRDIEAPRERLHFILYTLWRDIPAEDNGFSRNLMQSIATAPDNVEKPHNPLNWLEHILDDLLRECLPESRHYLVSNTTISYLAWMAFDGFVINLGKEESPDMDKLVEHFADMLIGQ